MSIKNFKFVAPTIIAIFLAGAMAFAGGTSEGGTPAPVPPRPRPPLTVVGVVRSIEPCAWYTPTISEHDPLWQCAQVSSDDAFLPRLEVVFSGSNDVAWQDSPKLQVGSSGEFVLDQNRLPGRYLLINFFPNPHLDAIDGQCSGVPNIPVCMIGASAKCCPTGEAGGGEDWMCVRGNKCPQRP